MSSGTRIHQWDFHGDLSQRWIFDYIGNGYYTIKSANSSVSYYLGVQNDSAAADTTVVLRTGTITDGMKWKVTKTSSGAYKLTAKCGESNNRVLAVGWSLLGINIDGIDIEQRDYSNDSDYIDEWFITPIYTASINNYYDKGYYVYYSENSDVSTEKIKQYLNDVSIQYRKLFGLKIDTNSVLYYNSPIDICKGTVSSSNIDTLCSHSGTIHTERNNVISSFNNHFSGSNTVTNVLWSCHRITSLASNGTLNENRSCSSGTSIFLIKRLSSSDRERDTKGVLMHELNHQYGAQDHYHELVDRNDPNSCKFKSICSVCGTNPRPSSCIMNNTSIDISNSNVICSSCKNEILSHLDDHHINN